MHELKHCNDCGQLLTPEEIKKKECWNCIAMQGEMIAFDENDKDLLPNVIHRTSPVED